MHFVTSSPFSKSPIRKKCQKRSHFTRWFWNLFFFLSEAGERLNVNGKRWKVKAGWECTCSSSTLGNHFKVRYMSLREFPIKFRSNRSAPQLFNKYELGRRDYAGESCISIACTDFESTFQSVQFKRRDFGKLQSLFYFLKKIRVLELIKVI